MDKKTGLTEEELIWKDTINKRVRGSASKATELVEKNWEIYSQYFFEYLKPHIKKDNSNAKVLDVGCGAGVIAKKLFSLGFDVYGVDFSDEVIKIAEEEVPGANFQVADICNLPFADETFDVVACLGVFPTVTDPGKALRESFRVLKKGGVIIVRTLNSRSLSFFRTRNKKYPFPFYLYCPFEFKNMVVRNGGKQVSIKGIYLLPRFFNFFTKIILNMKIYKIFNFLFSPIFLLFSHSFHLEGIKK
jgi:ubiquinone/menaquinone biosynthesis C-methylase UbiE